MVTDKLFDNAAAAAELLSMIGNEKRLQILGHLLDDEMSVGTIADKVSLSQSALSQHLAKLRMARILVSRHEGTKVFYRLANEHASQLVTDAIHQAEHSLGQPRHHTIDHSDH